MEYKTKICLLLLLFAVVCSSDCGGDLDKLFDNAVSQCDTDEPWTFSQTSVGSSDDARKFLTPNSSSSCITSHLLPIADRDVIRVNVYAKSIGEQDYVTVTVYEAAEDKVVGKATISNEENKVEDGWKVLEITLEGPGGFDGYIMLTGAVSTNSVLLVQSVCVTSRVEDTPQEGHIVKLTSNYRAPNVYVLQTEAVLKELIYPDASNVDIRATRFIDFEDFWTPLTITLAVVIPVIILILLGSGCYALGRSNASKQEPDFIYEDVNNLPKPYLVPRVKSVHAESIAGSSYGDRNNNIYSV